MYIARMKSKYSVRIYEALKQYEPLGERKFTLNDLRELVGLRVYDDKRKLIKDSMSRYPDFRRNVLDVATAEISELSDLVVSYEDIRPKNKVTGIVFHIARKDEKENEETLVELLEENKHPNRIEDAFVQRFGMSKEEAHELYEQAMVYLSEAAKTALQERNLSKDEYLWEKIQYCDWYTRICQKEVRNLVGFLHKAISENYWTISFERHRAGQKQLRVSEVAKEEMVSLEARKEALELEYEQASAKALSVWVASHEEEASGIMTQVRKIGLANRFYRPQKTLLENLQESDMIRGIFIRHWYEQFAQNPLVNTLYHQYYQPIIKLSKQLEQLKEQIGK